MLIEINKNWLPIKVTESIFDRLPRFTYSDTEEKIKIGDYIRWVYKINENKYVVYNTIERELMLINYDHIGNHTILKGN